MKTKNSKKPVVRDNAWFSKLSKAGKRVAIARDVLAQLKSGRLIATSGIWLRNSDNDYIVNEKESSNKELELQTIFKSKKACKACAMGGLFMCAVERANKLKVKELFEYEYWEGDGNRFDIDEEDTFDYLSRFFDRDQLKLIEANFEMGKGAIRDSDIGCTFWNTLSEDTIVYLSDHPEERMRLIMENIIAHKGDFEPEVHPKVYLTFSTPNFKG